MANKMKKTLAVLCATLATAALASAVGVTVQSAQPVSAELVDAVVMSTYTRGEEFVLPESVTIKEGGVEYQTTDSYLVFPDGKAYTGDKFNLTDCGLYKAVFETKVNGKRYVAEKEFKVEEGIFTVGMMESSFTYGQLNAQFPQKWGLTHGLLVDLAEGDTLTYHKPFNIFEQDTSELLQFNCMTTDLSVGTVTIRLTDCYDASNYIEILYLRLYRQELYFRAGVSGGDTLGVHYIGPVDGYVTIDGVEYVYMRNRAGTMLPCNRDQATVGAGKNPYNNNLCMYLDTTDREHIRVHGKTDIEPYDRLITELNNDTMYNSYWNGFTTGDVFLSISASGYSGRATAPIEIGGIMGEKGEALRPTTNKDVTPPTIVIEREGNSAFISKGVAVQVPEAFARDTSALAGDVKCAVYYGYGTEYEAAVSLKDGWFTPTNYGDYTVVYQATDVFGNVATKTYRLTAATQITNGIEFTPPSFDGKVAGDSISLGGYTASGLNGNVQVSMTLTNPVGVTKTYKETDSILLDRAGEYVATYTYSDAAYSYTKDVTFTVADQGKLGFVGNIPVPEYFIKNAPYTLDQAMAYRYTASAPETVALKYYASFDGAEYTEINPNEMTVTASESVKIKVVSAVDSSLFMETENIPVVDVNFGSRLSLENYFVGDFEGEANTAGIVYTATKSGDATMKFVNVLSLKNFNFTFAGGVANSIGSLTVTLTDYYNNNNQMSITLYKDAAGNPLMKITGGRNMTLTQNFDSGARTSITCTGKEIAVNSADVMPQAIDFTTDKCLLAVTLHDATEGEELNVYQVGNQGLRKIYSDLTDPMLVTTPPERVAKIGDIFTVKKPDVTDVLTPILAKNVSVSVYYKGNPVTAEDGTVMLNVSDFSKEYDIKITSYGDYLITYSFTDGKNGEPYTDAVRVIDNVAPQITLNTTMIEASVGQEISVGYTVSDNVTAANKMEVWYIVMDAEAKMHVTTNAPFTMNTAGVYRLQVWCIDGAGNATKAEAILTVK